MNPSRLRYHCPSEPGLGISPQTHGYQGLIFVLTMKAALIKPPPLRQPGNYQVLLHQNRGNGAGQRILELLGFLCSTPCWSRFIVILQWCWLAGFYIFSSCQSSIVMALGQIICLDYGVWLFLLGWSDLASGCYPGTAGCSWIPVSSAPAF